MLFTEGNLIYSVRQVGRATITEFYGYVVPPEEPPAPPDPLDEMQRQIDELTVTLGDLILGGGL